MTEIQPPETTKDTYTHTEPDPLGHGQSEERFNSAPELEKRASLDLENNNSVGPKWDAVGWNGPDDPEFPQNWPTSIRMGHVVLVSALSLLANLAATMFAPAASLLVEEFGVTSDVVGSLSVSLYMLGPAIGPLILAPLSEIYGRRIIYHACNVVFLAFTFGCAFSTSIGMFLVFRVIAGCAGSGPITIGGGTIADVVPQKSRGAAMSVFLVGPLIGPVIGPIAGGFIGQNCGWRWTFWVICIASGVTSLAALLLMRETYPPLLLERKAARIRNETGNLEVQSKSESSRKPTAHLSSSIMRPLKLLVLSPIVFSLSLFAAVAFGCVFLLFTTFPAVFEGQYGFTTGTSGLSYLGLGVGMLLGLFLFRAVSDRWLAKMSAGGEMKPEYRLPFMVYLVPIMPAGFFWYGWTAYYKVHWIAPIFGTAFIGIGALSILVPAQAYLIDAFEQYAASALAANTVMRCLLTAFLPLAGPPMYNSLGLGWGNSLMGFLALGLAPIPWFFYKKGEFVRKKWPVQL